MTTNAERPSEPSYVAALEQSFTRHWAFHMALGRTIPGLGASITAEDEASALAALEVLRNKYDRPSASAGEGER